MQRVKITVEMLEVLDACDSQLKKFRWRFPNGVVPTEKSVIEVAEIFDWNWVVKNFLKAENLKEYLKIEQSAREEYTKAERSAHKNSMK
jgi:hypothetical protein